MPTPTDDNNAWGRQGRKDGAYPPLAHAPREPRRNEQGPGNLLPGPRSYLSFHDCAAWSFPSGQKSSRYGLPVCSSSASPCHRKTAMVLLKRPSHRVPQPSRPGQPAACVGPATGGGRRPCVASTLCWPAGIENTSFPKPQKESTLRVLSSVDPAATYLSMPSPAQYFRRIRA